MDTCLWRYTHPRDGRVITKDHFSEAEALRIFPEPMPPWEWCKARQLTMSCALGGRDTQQDSRPIAR